MAKLIGAHLSISKGIYKIQKEMEMIGSNTCGIFLKSQRMYQSSPLDEKAINLFKKHVVNPEVLLPHGSYLINFCNPELKEKSMACFLDDLERCNKLGIKFYNMHPGSDVKKLGFKSLELISEGINEAMEKIPNVIILIENMAGQGNVVGSRFEEINQIINGIKNKDRIGVCLDTCHLYGAGYDIKTEKSFSKVMKEFDEKVGLKYLKALHLNDSKEPLNSKKDRHECIGKGHIGEEAFKFIMNNSIFDNIPMILETPDPSQYESEIKLLKSFINKNTL